MAAHLLPKRRPVFTRWRQQRGSQVIQPEPRFEIVTTVEKLQSYRIHQNQASDSRARLLLEAAQRVIEIANGGGKIALLPARDNAPARVQERFQLGFAKPFHRSRG
jgi:hypothetical protein